MAVSENTVNEQNSHAAQMLLLYNLSQFCMCKG